MDLDIKRKHLCVSVARVSQVTEDKHLQLLVGYLWSFIKKRQSLTYNDYCTHVISNCTYDQQHIRKYHLVPYDEMRVPASNAARTSGLLTICFKLEL